MPDEKLIKRAKELEERNRQLVKKKKNAIQTFELVTT